MKKYICKEVPAENGCYLEIEKELIQCEDCYFCGTFQRKNWCTKYEHSVKDDGFCRWAEPKEKVNGK